MTDPVSVVETCEDVLHVFSLSNLILEFQSRCFDHLLHFKSTFRGNAELSPLQNVLLLHLRGSCRDFTVNNERDEATDTGILKTFLFAEGFSIA
jgi:hypothetical protein